MAQPLVTGGLLDGDRYSGPPITPPASFISTTPPVIEEGTIIVAATSPNVQKGHPTRDGWFLSDFYAFNYLLKGLGSSQVWLTAADPRKLLEADKDHPFYLHGNPYQERKIVLSRDLLDSGELTPVTLVQNSGMVDRFLSEVRGASERAKRERVPLLLLLFCHGLPNYTFLLNHGEKNKGLTVTRLKEAIDPGCRVTLYSTACYSGGWVTRDLTDPSHFPVNATMLAAADRDGTSNAWQVSRSIRRSCGSVFASAVIETLTSASSPLLETPASEAADTPPLQPDNPNPEQTLSYNTFCRSILETCEDRVHRLWHQQGFTFSSQNDQWAYSWTGRTGVPLGYFEERWGALTSFQYSGPPEDKLNMDPHPSNPTFQGFAGHARTGGEGIIDSMTRSICHNRVATMAELLLETCPNDWDSGWGPYVRGCLWAAIEGKEIPDEDIDIRALIAFRWELGQLADYLVQLFKLPVPNNQICVLWDRFEWEDRIRLTIPDFYQERSRVWRELYRGQFEPEPTPAQGPPFPRFLEYMSAAVVEANLPQDQTSEVINGLLSFMQKVKRFHNERAVKETQVAYRGRQWLKTIGRAVRRSLSPRKKADCERASSRQRSGSGSSRTQRPGSSSSALKTPEFSPSVPARP